MTRDFCSQLIVHFELQPQILPSLCRRRCNIMSRNMTANTYIYCQTATYSSFFHQGAADSGVYPVNGGKYLCISYPSVLGCVEPSVPSDSSNTSPSIVTWTRKCQLLLRDWGSSRSVGRVSVFGEEEEHGDSLMLALDNLDGVSEDVPPPPRRCLEEGVGFLLQ